MIITLAGRPGSGKTTVRNILAKHYHLRKFSTGDFMRELARERGLTLLELSALAEQSRSIDEELDRRQKVFGEKEDDFIIDARLGWYFIPHSIKVFLDVNVDEAVKRIFNDDSENRKLHQENKTLELTKQKILQREKSEKKRYNEYYNVNYFDHQHYDVVVDTTDKSPQQVADAIIQFIDGKNEI